MIFLFLKVVEKNQLIQICWDKLLITKLKFKDGRLSIISVLMKYTSSMHKFKFHLSFKILDEIMVRSRIKTSDQDFFLCWLTQSKSYTYQGQIIMKFDVLGLCLQRLSTCQVQFESQSSIILLRILLPSRLFDVFLVFKARSSLPVLIIDWSLSQIISYCSLPDCIQRTLIYATMSENIPQSSYAKHKCKDKSCQKKSNKREINKYILKIIQNKCVLKHL